MDIDLMLLALLEDPTTTESEKEYIRQNFAARKQQKQAHEKQMEAIEKNLEALEQELQASEQELEAAEKRLQAEKEKTRQIQLQQGGKEQQQQQQPIDDCSDIFEWWDDICSKFSSSFSTVRELFSSESEKLKQE